MEDNKNKKSVKFQGDMLNFCDFIQVFVVTPNHHLKLQWLFAFLLGKIDSVLACITFQNIMSRWLTAAVGSFEERVSV